MSAPSVAVLCDLGHTTGVGHAMRCLALSEELMRRGCSVTFVCDTTDLAWVEDRIRAAGAGVVPPDDDPLAAVSRLGAELVVFDSYRFDSSVYERARSAGLTTMAFVDGDLRGAVADLLVDQNIGAEHDDLDLPDGAVRLAGLKYVVLRDEVARRRPDTPPGPRPGPPQVLAFLGGTDAFGAGPLVTQALVATGVRFRAVVVGASQQIRARIAAVVPEEGQQVEVIATTDRIGDLMAASDVVVCAGGTSLWEACALGRSAAVVCLVDNQVTAYQRVTELGAVEALGTLEELRNDPAAVSGRLRDLLASPSRRERAAANAWSLVDGEGKHRVVEALLALWRGRTTVAR